MSGSGKHKARAAPPLTPNPSVEARPDAVAKGLLGFALLCLALPLLATLVISLGPPARTSEHLVNLKQFQFALAIFSGALAAFLSKQAPVLNSIAVGGIGGAVLLLLSLIANASPHLGAADHLLHYVIATTGWSVLGGLAVALLRRNQNAL